MTIALRSNAKTRFQIDIRAFFWALILAPLVTAVVLFFLVVPLFAVPVGIVPYLMFGAPAYWMTLRQCSIHDSCTGPLVLAGICANFGSVMIYFIGFRQASEGRINDADGVLIALSFVFAALWSLVFAALYQACSRDPLSEHSADVFN